MNTFAVMSFKEKEVERSKIRAKRLSNLENWVNKMELKYPTLKEHKSWSEKLLKVRAHHSTPLELTAKQKKWQRKSTRAWRLKPMTLDEFRTFLGITIGIVIIKGRRIKDYWVENNAKYGNEWVSSRMTLERYQLIWKNFHCDVDWLISTLREKYQANWSPSQHVTFDETIVPFLGKFFAKVSVVQFLMYTDLVLAIYSFEAAPKWNLILHAVRRKILCLGC